MLTTTLRIRITLHYNRDGKFDLSLWDSVYPSDSHEVGWNAELSYDVKHINKAYESIIVENKVECRGNVSPTEVSPNENSWILRPLYYLSHGLFIPDRCVPTLDCMKVQVETRQFGLY
jgi:hypothetical protein